MDTGYKEYTTELRDASVLTESFIGQWYALEADAVEPNPYLSPRFQLPAFQWLCDSKPDFLCVWRHEDRQRLLAGLVVVMQEKGDSKLPFKHLSVFKSKHSFLGGMLIHSDFATEVSDQIAKYFTSPKTVFAGLFFSGLSADGHTVSLLKKAVINNRGKWFEDGRIERACLSGKESDGTRRQHYCISAKKKKDIRRKMRRLEEIGHVEWRYLEGEEVTDESIERFLVLEHMGWKAETKTSLLSSEKEANYFREMIRNFRNSNGVFFCELLLDGEVISSTCNLKIMNSGYAFKVSWDPEYRKYSPGILNEVEFLKALDGGEIELDYVDSGASEDSYINDLWLDRVTLIAGYMVFKYQNVIAAQLLYGLRQIKRQALAFIRKPG